MNKEKKLKHKGIKVFVALVIITILFSCENILNIEKSATVTVNVSMPGYYLNYAPEIIWYKNGEMFEIGTFNRMLPKTIKKEILYKFNEDPIIMVQVNVKNGFGNTTQSRTGSTNRLNNSEKHTINIVLSNY